MEKKIASGIMLALLLTSMLALALNIQAVRAGGTIYIRNDGSVDPPTAPIQRDGDVYTFTDDIYDSIVADRNNIVIDGAGYSLLGTGSGVGIDLNWIANVAIKNISISGFYCCVSLDSSSGNSISGNDITASSYSYGAAVLLISSSGNSISGNNITANRGYGVSIKHSSDNRISGNNISTSRDGSYYRYGIYLEASSGNNISGNDITSNRFGVSLRYSSNENSISGNNISNNDYSINLVDSSNNNSISGNDITNNGRGVYLYSSSGSNISVNNITNNGGGIDLQWFSSDNSISGNEIVNNGGGISFSDSFNNNISGNNITANNSNGIFLGRYSSGNNVSGNNITSNGERGIYLNTADDNSITGNNITANGWTGIFLNPSSYNNISDNDVAANGVGISLCWGSSDSNISGNRIKANSQFGISLIVALNNVVYHNNFENNAKQADIWDPPGLANIWDDGYPSGGNYWSDYEEKYPDAQELDDSGIWNTPYNIDENNQDNYPLMEPWTPTPPTIMASLDIDPDTLNSQSKGKWITAYIQLPEGYSTRDIDASTILLNGTIQPVLDPTYDFVTNSSEYLVVHDNDGIMERMVKFNRTEVESFITSQGIGYGNVALTMTGKLFDGTPFEGTNIIFVNKPFRLYYRR